MKTTEQITLDQARQRLTLSVAEAAALTATSRSWMYSALARGEIPGIQRVRGRVLVNAETFLAMFDADTT